MGESKAHGILILPFILTIFGILFCFWNLLDPSSVPCISSGCNLYQGGELGGLTVWWFGIFGFGLLAILAIVGKAKLGLIIAGIGLCIDTVLFIIMAMTLPCMSCLFVGFLLAITYYFFRKTVLLAELSEENTETKRSFLLLCWGLLFLVNIVLVFRGLIVPWALPVGDTSSLSSVSIYFSPSCAACQKFIMNLPESEVQKSTWYPISERSEDIAVIARLEYILKSRKITLAEAFTLSVSTEPFTILEKLSPECILLQLRLWVNKAHVLEEGDGRMPLLEFRGVPSMLLSNNKINSLPVVTDKNDDMLSLGFDKVGICGEEGNSQPCTE